MTDLSIYKKFSHTQRDFDVNDTIDPTFLDKVKKLIDEYIKEYNMSVFTDIVTDKREIKLLYSVAIHEFDGYNDDLAWKTNTQMLAPLLICITPKIRNDPINLIHIGRLYSHIGLDAINFEYSTGFCMAVNLLALRGYSTMVKYIHYHDNIALQMVWLCIGKPYDSSKLYCYSHIHNRYFHPKLRLHKNHINVTYES